MKLFIKNMDGEESRQWINSVLDELSISHDKDIELGEVIINSAVPADKFAELKKKLAEKEMTVLQDRRQILCEQVKYLVREMISNEEPPKENYSRFISSRLHLNYTYLANIFSETQGITIEHYTINQKIEKAKQFFLFGDYSISQVADMLHYSSIGHLSNQFKKVTGLNPTEFKKSQKN